MKPRRRGDPAGSVHCRTIEALLLRSVRRHMRVDREAQRLKSWVFDQFSALRMRLHKEAILSHDKAIKWTP